MRKIVRVLAIVLVIVMATSSAGCDKKSKIPDHMSEPVYNYGKKSVEIIDEYLDFKISTEEAHEKLQALMDMEDALPKHTGENEVSERANRSMVISHVMQLYLSTMSKKDSLDVVTTKRNELAKLLGLKER